MPSYIATPPGTKSQTASSAAPAANTHASGREIGGVRLLCGFRLTMQLGSAIGAERGAKLVARSSHPRPDRAHRATAHGGCLLVAEAEQLGEDERFASADRQGRHALPQVDGGGWIVDCPGRFGDAPQQPTPTGPRPNFLQADVAGDAEQPHADG